MMTIKKLILVCLVVSIVFTQTISLVELIKGSKNKLPPNCLNIDKDNKCIQCTEGYSLLSGACTKDAKDVKDNSLDPIDQPCVDKAACGDAQSFKNQDQLNKFINQYTPKQKQIYQTATLDVVRPSPVFQTTVSDVIRPTVFETIRFNQARPSSASQNIAFNQAKSLPTAFSNTNFMDSPSFSARPPAVDPNREFSTTNNQVQGVDEADIIKTDGTYIYSISNQILSIILAYPANRAKVVSEISFKGRSPSSIFIEGNYLAVFGIKTSYYYQNQVYETYSRAIYKKPYSYSTSYTYIKIYNIKNRANPILQNEYKICGNYFNGRKLDNGFMYLITTYSPIYLPDPIPWYDIGRGRRPLLFRDIFYYPIKYQSPSAVTVISFNLGNPSESTFHARTIFCQSASQMYMSESNIYLTFSSWESGYSRTNIRRIYVDQEYIRPEASGQVDGYILNQFSMDEFGSYFRIATTSNRNGNSNNVFVLNRRLRVVGSLTEIAKGETIKSARFLQKRLYLVTFRQVDPFFVIGFKNQRQPFILGELKITGFSSYLHPYDDETIIGIGRQADENGRTKGLKISIFDVSDVRNPTESAKFQIEETYASSIAEYEHKAFLLAQSKNLMVIPGTMNSQGNQAVKFNGAFAFYITKTEIDLRGVINHLQNDYDDFYRRNVERSLYIQDLLYTKSSCLLKINKLDQHYSGVKDIDLSCENSNSYVPPIPFQQPILVRPPIFRLPPIVRSPLPIAQITALPAA